MNELNFKKDVDFVKDTIYSVCLRGARMYKSASGNEYDNTLQIYTPKYPKNGLGIAPIYARVVSQKQFKFTDIPASCCADNYDMSAQHPIGLLGAMHSTYPGFDVNEIVTVLQFKIL